AGPSLPVPASRATTLATSDRRLRPLDQRPGVRTRWLLGGPRLLWFVVHRLTLHEQSVCRPKCAVLAGTRRGRVGKLRSDKKIAATSCPVERAVATAAQRRR